MNQENLEAVNINEFDFVDFGASKGGMIEEAKRRLKGKRGLGVDIDPKKVQHMRSLNYDCIQADFTNLKIPPKSVKFVTLSHTLEHLPNLDVVEKSIANAARIAQEFIFIKGPFFDADDFLQTHGVRMFYSNWYGHRCHFKVTDLESILNRLGLTDYVIYVRKPVADSADPSIQSLDCPRDQHEFIEGVHPPKPYVKFDQPVYQEFVAYVKLGKSSDWKELSKQTKKDFLLPSGYLKFKTSSQEKRGKLFSSLKKKILKKLTKFMKFKKTKATLNGTHRNNSSSSVKMIRVYEGDKKGATAFFRNRALMDEVKLLLDTINEKELKVLFHSCSIGAEPYSYAIHWKLNGVFDKFSKVTIHATDIEPEFLKKAVQGIYDASDIQSLTDQERSFFRTTSANAVVNTEIKDRIKFLPPQSFQDFKSETKYHVVFILNSLVYVSKELQSDTLQKISSYNSDYLITTAFHGDAIKQDMDNSGYAPVDRNLAAIHQGWGDRVKKVIPNTGEVPAYILPEFSEGVTDYKYKFCAVFRKI